MSQALAQFPPFEPMVFRVAGRKALCYSGNAMKKDIHPQYYPKAKVTCACGNTFTLGSTQETLQVEVCSNCHPFYTGRENLMDKVGRVQKFRERLAQKEKKSLRPLDKARGKKAQTVQKSRVRVTKKVKV